MVCWELFGPGEEDYEFLLKENRNPIIQWNGQKATVEIRFLIDEPGDYRLRVATVDLVGRTSVVWKNISIGN